MSITLSPRLDPMLIDKILPACVFKINSFKLINQFALAAKTVLQMYKKNLLDDNGLERELRDCMKGSTGVENIKVINTIRMHAPSFDISSILT